ncbi:hypothetical protein BDQ17DRAFT_1001747 [Cyathus striatus]|nr:hypothetical protein BDQ17DRAFT_1001747 [Cyathus striatus]
MTEFLDEVETLQTNVEGLKNLSESLATFNESFASWLYIMNMNSLTTDWPQAPIPESFELAKRRAEQKAIAAMEALKAKAAAREAREAETAATALAERTATTEITDVDTTYYANATTANTSTLSGNKYGTVIKKKGAKPKLTAREKKERSMEIERIISCLPLEFRGSDPNLRRNMENVIEGLFDAPAQTVKLHDLIKPPDLSQARVNKCLIALVNRKAVQKDNSTGAVLYRWQGIP